MTFATGILPISPTSGSVSNESIAVDSSGNSYITGSFSGTVKFGTASYKHGPFDMFVAKLDPTGKVLGRSGLGLPPPATATSAVPSRSTRLATTCS